MREIASGHEVSTIGLGSERSSTDRTSPSQAFAFPQWREARDQAVGLLSTHTRLAVTGPAGVGKSTLLQELARLLRAGGCEVVLRMHHMPSSNAAARARPVAFLIDEADRLPGAELDALLALPGCNVVLAGLPDLCERCPAIQRLDLTPLPLSAAEDFVRLWLSHHRHDSDRLDPEAVTRAAELSGGVLRVLTGILNGALWICGANGGRRVSLADIEDAAEFRQGIAEVAIPQTKTETLPDSRAVPPAAAVRVAAPAGKRLAEMAMARQHGIGIVPFGLPHISYPVVPLAPVTSVISAPERTWTDLVTVNHGPALTVHGNPIELRPGRRVGGVLAGVLLLAVIGLTGGYTVLRFRNAASSPPGASEPAGESSLAAAPPIVSSIVPESTSPPVPDKSTASEPTQATNPAETANAAPEPPPERLEEAALEPLPDLPAAAAPEQALDLPILPATPVPPVPEPQAQTRTAALVSPPALPRATLSTAVMQLLVQRGGQMASIGDISGARLLFARAAEAGNGAAAFELGRLFDPAVLEGMGARMPADPSRAADWYRRAAVLGEPRATELLAQLEARTER